MIAPAATVDDIALVPQMIADGVGIALVVVFADFRFGKYLQRSLVQ